MNTQCDKASLRCMALLMLPYSLSFLINSSSLPRLLSSERAVFLLSFFSESVIRRGNVGASFFCRRGDKGNKDTREI